MYCTLIITRYPKYSGVFGLFSMALFRLPLYFNNKIQFYKLMGSGKNGAMDIHPGFREWALLFTTEDRQLKAPAFIYRYWKLFHCSIREFLLQPVEGFGRWDGKCIFGELPKESSFDGRIAVLTRATIRVKCLKSFWGNVDSVAGKTATAKGLVISYGIGEMPWIKQATFSVWDNKKAMKDFAYSLEEHKKVIYKTRNENWYKEEMFVRFKILAVRGFAFAVDGSPFTI